MQEWVENKSLIPNSDAWRSARRRRIGGSDIPVIMRCSPYKTRRELWEEKTGRTRVPDISRLAHVKRGVDAEPIARRILERRRRIKYAVTTVVHTKYEWAVATLDGLAVNHVIEIKTQSLEAHLDARDGIVPWHYELQLQWGLMCSGKKWGLFVSFRPEDGSIYDVRVRANPELHDDMITRAREFMEWVTTDTEPPYEFEFDETDWNL